jgi:hypothetical protein
MLRYIERFTKIWAPVDFLAWSQFSVVMMTKRFIEHIKSILTDMKWRRPVGGGNLACTGPVLNFWDDAEQTFCGQKMHSFSVFQDSNF